MMLALLLFAAEALPPWRARHPPDPHRPKQRGPPHQPPPRTPPTPTGPPLAPKTSPLTRWPCPRPQTGCYSAAYIVEVDGSEVSGAVAAATVASVARMGVQRDEGIWWSPQGRRAEAFPSGFGLHFGGFIPACLYFYGLGPTSPLPRGPQMQQTHLAEIVFRCNGRYG